VGITSIGKVVDATPSPAQSSTTRQPAVRVAQLADTHVFQGLDCPARMRKFLTRFHAVAGTPDVALHSGDIIYDALDTDRDQVAQYWQLWHEFARELPSPVFYAIGNHDVWGKGPTSDALYGKNWAVQTLKMPNRYYSFAKGPWQFIVLDSVHPIPRGSSSLPGASHGWYTAKLDEEQLSWLEGELSKTQVDTPIAIVSHIPILSASIFEWAKAGDGAWTILNRYMHSDSQAIQAVLRRHANVKLCLSGHLHLLDQVVYDGITYLGCGAVCADGWNHQMKNQTHCGFATLDLFADGSFRRTYHPYDW
jgi:3',5'-cyclic AMP phosphodiesterase CpdA